MKTIDNIRLGPPVIYAPIVRRPALFPFQAGIVGYRRIPDGRVARFCVVTGEPFEGKKHE